MKKMPLLLIVFVFFAVGCKEKENESLQWKSFMDRKKQDSVVLNSLYENPPLVGDVSEACPLCSDPSEIIVHRAPFDALKPYHKKMELDSGAALSSGKVLQSVLNQTNFIKSLYQKYLERMQSENGDSAYFAGKIVLKLSINENGPVDDVSITSSTTGNTQFDHEVRDSIRTWIFPKADGKSVVSFPLEFVKTKYSKGDVEIVKSGL